MEIIVVTNQIEFDNLPAKFDKHTQIQIRGNIIVNLARENSHVEAWENSHVEAWENSHVVAWGNSHVEAWENSHVVARGNSHVEAWGNVCVHNYSIFSNIELFSFAVVFLVSKTNNIIQRSKNSTIIIPSSPANIEEWIDSQSLEIKNNSVVLFKRVSSEYKTREGERNETKWDIGSILVHQNWNPSKEECGDGKFHACSRPYFCDEFRDKRNDKYIAIKVNVEDLFVWTETRSSYPHKIAFRKGEILYECDRYGNKIN